MLLPSPTKANIYHSTTELGIACLVCAVYVDVRLSPAPISKGLWGMGLWGGVGGMPSVFAEVFV